MIAIIFACAIIGVLGLMLIWRKHRAIWNKIWEMDKVLSNLREENITLRKHNIMNSISSSRLDLLMPSQHGEDIWLWNFFNKKRDGFFVEVGAYNGITFSNTYFLEAIGWQGILIEPNPDNFKLCAESRLYSICINAAVCNSCKGQASLTIVKGDNGVDALSFTRASGEHLDRVARTGAKLVEVKVPALSLERILEKVERPIDIISIDVEGTELEVLESLNFDKHGPSILIVEDNSYGQDKSVETFLLQKGYKFEVRLGGNVLYAKA